MAAQVPARITDMRVIGVAAPQQGGQPQGPTSPSNVQATAISAGQVDVSWTASTSDTGTVAGYQIFRGGVPLNTTSVTSYSDLTCQPSTTYSYVIVAFDALGNNSPPSTTSSATTPANAAPVWASIPTQTLQVGNAYLLQLTAYCTDADLDPLTFTVASGALPDGITLSGSRLQGTCTTAGQALSVTIRAADVFHQSDAVVAFTTYTVDVTAPPVPTNVQATAASSSQINVTWTDSVDAAGSVGELVSGTKDYRVYRSMDGSAYSLRATVTADPYADTGLSASTAYWYKVTARDNALNESSQSTAATATTQSTGSWFPNWPIMTAGYLIGNYTGNYGDTTNRVYTGELNILIAAWFYPTTTRFTPRATALDFLKTNYPGLKIFLYTGNDSTIKTITSAGSDAKELTKTLVEDATKGNPNWYLRRVNGQQTESLFDPTNFWEFNVACLVAGLNSLGQRYDQAWVQRIWDAYQTSAYASNGANFFSTYFTGIYIDNFEARCQAVYVNNGGTLVTDIDFDGDGVADTLNDYSSGSTAGGRFQSEGNLQFKASTEAKFGNLMIPNASRWPYDYFDGRNLKPPLPLSNHPCYGKWEVILRESSNLDFGLTRTSGTSTGLSYVGVDPLGTAFARMTIHERFLTTDAAARSGKACVLLEAYTPSRTNNAFTLADYAFSRFHLCAALMMERTAHAVSSGKNIALPLDELFLDLGTPIGTRSMGTLNETTLGFTARSPDFTSGVAKFWWQRYTKGIVVLRLDPATQGVWPSADAAVSCTLPAPGTGKKWQMINAATYVSPAIWPGPSGTLVTRAMRGQDTSLNNGADVTTISLRPMTGAIVRLV